MNNSIKRSVFILLAVAMLGSTTLLSGCQETALDKKPHPISSVMSDSVSDPASQSAQTSSAEEPTSSASSEQNTSTVPSTQLAQTAEPQSSSSHSEETPPTSRSVRICSLSEALSEFSDIANKPVEGTPEEIVKTLMDKNVLCFAAMQGKCWTAEGSYGVQPIVSSYIKSVEQVEKLFADTYTENQAWRLMHPQEAGGYGKVFRLNSNGKLCFDLSHLRSKNGDSFSTGTYISIVEADDSEITFERHYTNTPSGGNEPNVQNFKAIKENGKWRLETYITDAPAYVQPYSTLITTKRKGNPELMELAKKQVGNIGGREFWEWCGFDYHIEWCAAFVSWAYAQAGKDGPYFLGCYTGAEWFKARGQWGGRNYADIAPGDAIFFDWNFDGDADHVGLVIGTDGEYVYTVEGNRDDICITRGYNRASYSYIMGYGLMEW